MSDVTLFAAGSFIIVIVYLVWVAVCYFNVKVEVGSPRICWKQEAVYKFVRGKDEKQIKGLVRKTKQLAGGLDVIVISYSDGEDREHSTAVGCLLPSNDVSQAVVQKLIIDGYQRTYFPELSYAVHTSVPFPTKFMLPYIRRRRMLSMKCFTQKRRLCAHPTIEIHQGRTVYFVAPLSQQDDYYVAEASALHIWRQLPVAPLQNVHKKHCLVASKSLNSPVDYNQEQYQNNAVGNKAKKKRQSGEIPAGMDDSSKMIVATDENSALKSVSQMPMESSQSNGYHDEEQFKKPTRILRRGRGSHNTAKTDCEVLDDVLAERPNNVLTDRRSLSSTLLMPLWVVKNALLKATPAPRSLSEMPLSAKLWRRVTASIAETNGDGLLDDSDQHQQQQQQQEAEAGELQNGDESPVMTSLRQQLRSRQCKTAAIAKKKFIPLAHSRQLCCVEN